MAAPRIYVERTMTVAELRTHCEQPGWTHNADWDEEVACVRESETEECEVRGAFDIHTMSGWAQVTSEKGGVTVEYTETFRYERGNRDATFESSLCDYECWRVSGVKLIDDDGREVSIKVSHLNDADFFDDLHQNFTAIDYPELMGPESVDDIDAAFPDVKTEGAETFKIRRTGNLSMIFDGSLLARVDSPRDPYGSRFTGVDLRVYETVAGRIVYQRSFWSRWQGAEATDIVDVFYSASVFVEYLRALLEDARDGEDRELENELLERIS